MYDVKLSFRKRHHNDFRSFYKNIIQLIIDNRSAIEKFVKTKYTKKYTFKKSITKNTTKNSKKGNKYTFKKSIAKNNKTNKNKQH